MFGRCRAWSLNADRKHTELHDPGTCRSCWSVCLNKRHAGTSFCDDCWWDFAKKTPSHLKLELLSRPDVPREIVEYLANDLDASVRYEAEELLDADDSDTADAPGEPLDDTGDDIDIAEILEKSHR